jgi:hypothetical protein
VETFIIEKYLHASSYPIQEARIGLNQINGLQASKYNKRHIYKASRLFRIHVMASLNQYLSGLGSVLLVRPLERGLKSVKNSHWESYRRLRSINAFQNSNALHVYFLDVLLVRLRYVIIVFASNPIEKNEEDS